MAHFAGIGRGEAGPHHELALLEVLHIRADLFKRSPYTRGHCGRFGRVVGTAVGPKVGAANTSGSQFNDRVGGLPGRACHDPLSARLPAPADWLRACAILNVPADYKGLFSSNRWRAAVARALLKRLRADRPFGSRVALRGCIAATGEVDQRSCSFCSKVHRPGGPLRVARPEFQTPRRGSC